VLYLVRAMVYLLQVALGASGMAMLVTSQAQPPSPGTNLGTAAVLGSPVRVLRIVRGTGQQQVVLWTGYWTLAT